MWLVGRSRTSSLVLRYVDAARSQGKIVTDQLLTSLRRRRISRWVHAAPFPGRRAMEDPAIGWIAAIIVGGIAGWLAEQFMKSDMGVLMNIVLGIVGAAVASA